MPPPTLNSEEPLYCCVWARSRSVRATPSRARRTPNPCSIKFQSREVLHCCGAVVFFLTVLDPAKLIGYDRPMLISGSVFMRPLTSR